MNMKNDLRFPSLSVLNGIDPGEDPSGNIIFVMVLVSGGNPVPVR
jgi:hypothetical protein